MTNTVVGISLVAFLWLFSSLSMSVVRIKRTPDGVAVRMSKTDKLVFYISIGMKD